MNPAHARGARGNLSRSLQQPRPRVHTLPCPPRARSVLYIFSLFAPTDSSYPRVSVLRSVRKLGLTDADFDTVAVTLADTLREFKLTEAQIKQAMDVVGTTRESVRETSCCRFILGCPRAGEQSKRPCVCKLLCS